MADSYDRYDSEGSGGGFMMGLLTGTVLGAGLGMLLAPKAGSELRGAIGEQARNLGNKATDGYRRASEQAGGWAEKGREFVDKAKDAVSRGAEEARGYTGGTSSGGSSFGGSTSSTPTTPSSGGDFGRS
jgi:gas vesicle protein